MNVDIHKHMEIIFQDKKSEDPSTLKCYKMETEMWYEYHGCQVTNMMSLCQ